MYKLSEDNIKEFLLGGYANFVLKNITNNHHIEYTIKIKEETRKLNRTLYFVSYKSTEWQYIGILVREKVLSNGQEKEEINFHFKTDISVDHYLQAKTFKGLIEFIYHKDKLPNNVEILYTGQCSICNRKLTDPKYINIGIGPTCLKNN